MYHVFRSLINNFYKKFGKSNIVPNFDHQQAVKVCKGFTELFFANKQ